MIKSEWSGEMPEECPSLEYHFYAGCSYNDHGRLYAETKRIVWSWTDGTDEPNFAWVVELKDGTFASVQGGHDYTGWDCQSSLEVCHVAATVAEVVTFFTDDPRRAYEEQNP